MIKSIVDGIISLNFIAERSSLCINEMNERSINEVYCMYILISSRLTRAKED